MLVTSNVGPDINPRGAFVTALETGSNQFRGLCLDMGQLDASMKHLQLCMFDYYFDLLQL